MQDLVAAGIKAGKNPQQIAQECSKAAKQEISNMSVRRYLDTVRPLTVGDPVISVTAPPKQVEQAVKQAPERVQRLVDRDIDLIDLMLRTTDSIANRFQWVSTLPDIFDDRMRQLHELLRQEGTDTKTLDLWGLAFTLELRRNIGSMAALNREIRENLKFMAQLREKAFEFNLVQEYLFLFMEVFRETDQAAYEIAEAKIASNPRMQRIVEQQQQLRGYDQA